MKNTFSFSDFLVRFPDDDRCLEEIKKFRYPNGLFCVVCHATTKHYRVANRMAYLCKCCRNQVYPLVGTIFEKTTTPLRLWMYAMFLMTHTKGGLSAKQLQRELGVTYKTAWRMYQKIYFLMQQNNGDLLSGSVEIDEAYQAGGQVGKNNVRRWTLFNKLEITLIQKLE